MEVETEQMLVQRETSRSSRRFRSAVPVRLSWDEHARPLIVLADILAEHYSDMSLHGEVVARYCEATAEALELDGAQVERIRLAGALHDIGKVGVPDAILNKPGPLTREEWREVRKHPELGARLLRSSGLDDMAGWVAAHHERPDGRGYPHGLYDGAIPRGAKILAVADAYDAMRTDRVYRPALSDTRASGELLGGAGTQFDPEVVDAFLSAI